MASLVKAAGAGAVSTRAEDIGARAGSVSLSLARVLLVGTLLAAPWAFGAVETWAWVLLAEVAALSFLLWAVGCVRRGVLKVAWSPLFIPGGLFILLGLSQLASHSTLDPVATRESLLKLTTDFLFFFLAVQFATTESQRKWQRMGLLATVFGFVLAVFSILQFFSSDGLIYWSVKTEGWAFGPYVNHNHYAGLLELLIPVSAAYFLSRPRKHPGRVMLFFAVSIMLTSVLLSGSRGGMLSLLAEILIVAVIAGSSVASPDWRKWAIVGPLTLLTVSLSFFWLDPGRISGRLATTFKLSRTTDVSFAQREQAALDSLRGLRDHPWLGTGLGSFEVVSPRYRSFASDFLWDHAHNDYAEGLLETGLVGGVLISVAVLMVVRFSLKNLGVRLKQEAGKIQLGAALGCFGLLIHSLFDFNLHIPANALWFVVCVAGATRGAVTAETEALSGHH